MAFIDVVNWDSRSNSVFAYKFPNTNLSTATQLLVRESQEAVLFSKGQLMGKFGPGKHTLSTENLPILRNLFGIPFGGKNPFTAEVWFVNKTAPLNIDWEATGMNYIDPVLNNSIIPVAAKGRYGLKVSDAEKFLIELVGSLTTFTASDLTDHFKGMLISKTNSFLMTFMKTNNLSIAEISAYQDDLSDFLRQSMSGFWSDYGFDLIGFYITEVGVDTSTENGRAIAKAIADRSTQGITGHSWQEEQMFNAAQAAAEKGSGMGILGASMFMGGFMNNSFGGMGNNMQPSYGGANMGVANQQRGFMRKEWFCAVCGTKHPVTSQFCDNCGHHYNPCPACGNDNSDKDTKCIKCGTQLGGVSSSVGSVCWKCGSPVKPGKKFCSNCGAKQ